MKNSEQQMELCKKCKNQKFDSNNKVICQLTNEKPDFEGICQHFVEETKHESYADIKQTQETRKKEAYKIKNSLSNIYIIGGYVILAISLITLILIQSLFLFPGALFLLYIGYWQKDREAIIIFDKYIQIKIAPLSAIKHIRYEDITRIKVISKKRVLIYKAINGKKEKKTYLPVSLLSDNDRNDLLNKLNMLTR